MKSSINNKNVASPHFQVHQTLADEDYASSNERVSSSSRSTADSDPVFSSNQTTNRGLLSSTSPSERMLPFGGSLVPGDSDLSLTKNKEESKEEKKMRRILANRRSAKESRTKRKNLFEKLANDAENLSSKKRLMMETNMKLRQQVQMLQQELTLVLRRNKANNDRLQEQMLLQNAAQQQGAQSLQQMEQLLTASSSNNYDRRSMMMMAMMPFQHQTAVPTPSTGGACTTTSNSAVSLVPTSDRHFLMPEEEDNFSLWNNASDVWGDPLK